MRYNYVVNQYFFYRAVLLSIGLNRKRPHEKSHKDHFTTSVNYLQNSTFNHFYESNALFYCQFFIKIQQKPLNRYSCKVKQFQNKQLNFTSIQIN